MRLVLWVGIVYLLAVVTPWIVGTVLGYNPKLSGLAFMIILGIALMVGAYIGQLMNGGRE